MLILSADTVKGVLRWAERYSSIEVCGMVWQYPDGGQIVRPLRNTHPEPRQYYTIDAEEMQGMYRAMERSGAQVLAFYHSHPNGKPDPSESDMEGALNVGVHYLIAYPDSAIGTWRLSAWDCIEQGILVEDSYECG